MYNTAIETNIISVMMLVTIFFSLKSQLRDNKKTTKVLMWLLWATNFTLIINSLRIVLDGNQTVIGGVALIGATLLYYVLLPIVVVIWFHYVVSYLFDSNVHHKFLRVVLYPLLLIHTIFAILSVNGGYLFTISDSNIYSRGPSFLVTASLTFFFVFLSTLYIVYYRKEVQKNGFLPLMLFGAPPSIAAIIQIYNPGISIISPSLAVSILMVFIYIQSRIANTDYLTGLSNRRDYENHLFSLEQKKYRGYKLGGIVIDIDNFKKINDIYGHATGDEVLVAIGAILRSSVRKDDFVARLGGDEFGVTILHKEDGLVNDVVKRIRDNIAKFNRECEKGYQISLSMGYGVYNKEETTSVAEFYIHLDNKMYEHKEQFNKDMKLHKT